MRPKNWNTLGCWIVVLGLLAAGKSAFAQDNAAELKTQIEELQAKVAALEARQNAAASKKDFSDAAGPGVGGGDAFDEMERMHQDMSRLFSQAFNRPSVPHTGMFSDQMFFDNSRIEETEGGYVIKVNTAGFDQEKIDINVRDDSLSISGEYKKEDKQQGQNSVFESHNYGKFLNTIPLPKDADTSKMKTEKKGNQLEIFLPKKT